MAGNWLLRPDSNQYRPVAHWMLALFEFWHRSTHRSNLRGSTLVKSWLKPRTTHVLRGYAAELSFFGSFGRSGSFQSLAEAAPAFTQPYQRKSEPRTPAQAAAILSFRLCFLGTSIAAIRSPRGSRPDNKADAVTNAPLDPLRSGVLLPSG